MVLGAAKRGLKRCGLVLSAVLLASIPAGPDRIPETVRLSDLNLRVFTYRPAGCQPAAFLVVIHGSTRDAGNYRDYVRPAADRLCLIALVPEFDTERFPTARFRFCGRMDGGERNPPEEWVGRLLVQLVDWARVQEQAPGLPYIVLGHSSGGGAASCFAAFTPNEASAIVIANPSGLVRPSADTRIPFGFAGPNGEELFRRYLAAPITLVVGEEDTKTEQQGLDAFRMAQAAADARGWPFGWRLVDVPGVGHWAGSMLPSPGFIAALQDDMR
jgi:dienelactone hydrolase